MTDLDHRLPDGPSHYRYPLRVKPPPRRKTHGSCEKVGSVAARGCLLAPRNYSLTRKPRILQGRRRKLFAPARMSRARQAERQPTGEENMTEPGHPAGEEPRLDAETIADLEPREDEAAE